MITTVFYFTGTGNSLMVARTIATDLEDARIVPIHRAVTEGVSSESDIIGLVFPVYWGGLPLIVHKFLPLLQQFQGRYLFAVVTHAGGPGKALSQLRDELNSLGLELSSGFSLRMPSNYVISYDAPDADEIEANLKRADRTIPDIIRTVRDRTVQQTPADSSGFKKQSGAYEKFITEVHTYDKNFSVDDNCTECGDCVRVCPVENIMMSDGIPTWLHHCEQCLACINWCPASAIQYGSGTSRRGRYTNPRVSIDEIAHKRLRNKAGA